VEEREQMDVPKGWRRRGGTMQNGDFKNKKNGRNKPNSPE
jgi:hypothetical protein